MCEEDSAEVGISLSEILEGDEIKGCCFKFLILGERPRLLLNTVVIG